MVSVLVMLIWGYVEGSFEHSWLAVMAAGICMAAISMIRKDRRDSENKDGPLGCILLFGIFDLSMPV